MNVNSFDDTTGTTLGSLKGLGGFKKKSRPFFIIIFKLKNGNFKTRDSPLIERVLAGVI